MPKLPLTGLWRPLACVLTGILLYHFIGRSFPFAGEAAVFFVLLFLISGVLAWKKPLVRRRAGAGVAGMAALVALAFWGCFLKNSPQMLSVPAEEVAYYSITLVEGVAVKPASVSSVAQVTSVKDSAGVWQPAKGKMALSMPRSWEAERLRYGDQLLVRGGLTRPSSPANPFQFDYRQFLANKHIHWQVYLTPEKWVLAGFRPPSSVRAVSFKIRKNLELAFKKHLTQKRELAIAQALVLGLKDDLDLTLRDTYSRTGTMHVLAVSGLHVGAFYAILFWLLRPFRYKQGGRLAVGLLILAILWFYAFLTGLAPSVLRSVIMFTVVEVGFILQRRPRILNSLGVAGLVLLLYDPNLLLDVGFQLSFSAVAGIVLLQPLLAGLWKPSYKVSRFFWGITTVSVAAQLATFPLSLYYFHQFPVYFGVTNLFAIPMATGALYAGILFMVVVPFSETAAHYIGLALQEWLWFLNEGLAGVQHWPQAVLEGIVVSPGQVLALYVALATGVLFVKLKNLRWLAVMVLCVVFISSTELAEARQQRRTRELVLYSVRRSSALSLVNGRTANLLADSAFFSQPLLFTYNVQPHWWARGVRNENRFRPGFEKSAPKGRPVVAHASTANQLLVWHGKRILWLQQTPAKPEHPVKVDAVVLQRNVRVTPRQLQALVQTGTVVLDQTNSRRYTLRKAQELRALGYRVHRLEQDGAWVIRK